MKPKILVARRSLWQQRLENWQASQLSTAEWCRQHQLPEHQFFYWKRKLMPRTRNKLVPVIISADATPTVPDKITIHLPSGLRIEMETTDVVALIQQLEAS